MSDKNSTPAVAKNPATAVKLVGLTVLAGASQRNVTGAKNWAAVKSAKDSVIVEATTFPKNNDDEWKQINWSGGSTAVLGKLNRRSIPLSASKHFHVEAALGGITDSVDIWVLWATIEILMSGLRPVNAAAFDVGMRDNTDKLGAVVYDAEWVGVVIDEDKGIVVPAMGASQKVAPVATLTPSGVNAVVQAGWTFERQVFSHIWQDGQATKQTNVVWTRDTSQSKYLKLKPNNDDKIFDLDGPNINWGQVSFEAYQNFRQWIEWNGAKCSEFGLWCTQVVWHANADPQKQIELNVVQKGNITLPSKPKYPSKAATASQSP